VNHGPNTPAAPTVAKIYLCDSLPALVCRPGGLWASVAWRTSSRNPHYIGWREIRRPTLSYLRGRDAPGRPAGAPSADPARRQKILHCSSWYNRHCRPILRRPHQLLAAQCRQCVDCIWKRFRYAKM